MSEVHPSPGPRRLPTRPAVEDVLEVFPQGVLAAVQTPGVQPKLHGWGAIGNGVVRSVKIEVGDVVVETEREQPQVNRVATLLSQLIFPRLLHGPLSFPMELRIDRHELQLDVAGVNHAFEAFALDGKVIAHAEIEGAHVVVECRRDLWEKIRLAWLGGKALAQAL